MQMAVASEVPYKTNSKALVPSFIVVEPLVILSYGSVYAVEANELLDVYMFHFLDASQ